MNGGKSMRKTALFLVICLVATLLAGCAGSGSGNEEPAAPEKEVITVACTAEPHATILE